MNGKETKPNAPAEKLTKVDHVIKLAANISRLEGELADHIAAAKAKRSEVENFRAELEKLLG